MAYFYYKNGVLHKVDEGEQIPGSKPLPQNENESLRYARSLNIDLKKAKRGILTAKNRRIAEDYNKRFPGVVLSAKEYNYLRSEFNNHLSDIERGSPLICRTLQWNGVEYRYTAINFGFNDYKVIRRVFDDLNDGFADAVMEGINKYE